VRILGGNDSKLFYLVVGKNIKKYRDIRNFSLQVLAEKIGLTKKTIQRYETGEIKIDMDRISDIANALNVRIDSLLEGAYEFLGLSVNDLQMVSLPIVGKVSCGAGALALEEIEGYEQTPKSWLNGGEYFYTRAQGDSMINARIHDGDLVLIRKQSDVDDGEIAAVVIDDHIFLKRVYKRDGTIILQSENNLYPPKVYNSNDVGTCFIVGKLKKVVVNY